MTDKIFVNVLMTIALVFIFLVLIKRHQNTEYKNKGLSVSRNNDFAINHSKEELMDTGYTQAGMISDNLDTQPDFTDGTDVSIILLAVPNNRKIAVLKEIRAIMFFGLKEAKEFIEAAPVIIKKTSKPEAEEIKKRLESAGATVEIK